MSRKPRIKTWVSQPADIWTSSPCSATEIVQPTIPTPPDKLKVGDAFWLGPAIATVTIASPEGVTVHLNLGLGDDPDLVTPSGIHRDGLLKLYPDGIPVLWEPNVFTGETTITAAGDPMTLTMGQVTSLLPDMVRNEGKAKPGERYRVTFEQLPGVE